jgi:hypothetical protein
VGEAHRNFTAKTAKLAKAIAKNIAWLTHRTITASHRGLAQASRLRWCMKGKPIARETRALQPHRTSTIIRCDDFVTASCLRAFVFATLRRAMSLRS